jgi:hypothetical protein
MVAREFRVTGMLPSLAKPLPDACWDKSGAIRLLAAAAAYFGKSGRILVETGAAVIYLFVAGATA